MARATGANFNASGLSCHAATKNNVIAAMAKNRAKDTDSAPVARARILVRGFSLS